jgi:hypothetical protein
MGEAANDIRSMVFLTGGRRDSGNQKPQGSPLERGARQPTIVIVLRQQVPALMGLALGLGQNDPAVERHNWSRDSQSGRALHRSHALCLLHAGARTRKHGPSREV